MTRFLPAASSLALLLGLVGCATSPTATPGEPAQGTSRWFDVPFAERAGEVLLADVVRPLSAVGPQPAIVLLHPGGWTGGSKRLMRGAAERLAEAGFVAVAPSYRLAPEHRFPRQLDDVADCVRWMRQHADLLGILPEQIGVLGYSAGGHLAALMGTSAPAGARVQAVAVGGVPADLIELGPNPRTTALLGGEPRTHVDLFEKASPTRLIRGTEPPFLIQHGLVDAMIPASQATTLRDALRGRGVPVEFESSWLGHFAFFLLRNSGVERAVPFFDFWLRDPVALEQTRDRVDGPAAPRAEASAGAADDAA